MPIQPKQQPPYYSEYTQPETDAILTKEITLTDAQIKALRTTGVDIIPAPGANKTINIINAIIHINTTAGAYTNVTEAALTLQSSTNQYFSNIVNIEASLSNARTSIAKLTGTFLEDGASSLTGFPITYAYDTSGYINVAIQLKDFLGGSDYTNGNAANTLTITVYYTIKTL